MNCKPGELAILINGFDAPENVGAIVRVVSSIVVGGEVCWFFKEASRPLVFYGAFNRRSKRVDSFSLPGGIAPIIEDRCLMPIRDPGDDEVDEMVRKVGAPEGVAV